MEPWALLGQIFAILGRLGRVSFFHAFFDCQKVGPKSQKSATLAARRRPRAKNEAARRSARGHQGGGYGEGAEIFA